MYEIYCLNFCTTIFVANTPSDISSCISLCLYSSLMNECSQGELNKVVSKNDARNDEEDTDQKSTPTSSKHHLLLLQVR